MLSGTNSLDGGGIKRARRVNSQQNGQDFRRFDSGGMITSEPQTELNEHYILAQVLRWAGADDTIQIEEDWELPVRWFGGEHMHSSILSGKSPLRQRP